MGFGSFGVPLGNPAFPGEAVYPYGMLSNAVASYDLTGFFDSGPSFAISCVDFPATCQAPLALATTSGDLLLDHVNISAAIFSSVENPVTPFASFDAQVVLRDSPSKSFKLSSRFTLGAGNNGINPVSESVSVLLGSYSASIPQGSFRKNRRGDFVFAGTVGGVGLDAKFTRLTGDNYEFSLREESHDGHDDQDEGDKGYDRKKSFE